MLLNNDLTGVLLLNLGTPRSHKTSDVRRYLNQFLMDPRVIELPTFLRWILVKFLITPFRSSKSAAAYKEIWLPEGSPLLINSNKIKNKLAAKLGSNYLVTLGMRYAEPSINSALEELKKASIQKILVVPLFPQYSSAATGSALAEVLRITSELKVITDISIKQSFFSHLGYIQALTLSIKPYVIKDFDYLLMSYHGLPEQQMLHEKTVNCDLIGACPSINLSNASCYRAQCYQTSRLLAQSLNLNDDKWGLSFQSRLGRLPWIKPYTDEMLITLSQQGIKNLVICCPSFVADCLETLEEIGIRAREQWLVLGGRSLQLVPCLNDQALWIDALADMVIKDAL